MIKLEEQDLPMLRRILALNALDMYNTYLNQELQDELARVTRSVQRHYLTTYDYNYGDKRYAMRTQRFYSEKQQELER